MKYITLFDTFDTYKEEEKHFVIPHVSYIQDITEVRYNAEPHDFSKDYFTFVALEPGTFTLSIGSAVPATTLLSISYSLDEGETWVTTNNQDNTSVTITTPTVDQGDKVLWKGVGSGMSITTNASNWSLTSSIFSSSGNFNAEGNIMSLLYGDNFIGETTLQGTYNFAALFYNIDDTKIINAKNMRLCVDNVTDHCYYHMFRNSTLATAPKLPATSLAVGCYMGMFMNCDSLVNAPSSIGVSSTIMPASACKNMFSGCSSLVTAPELPATNLSGGNSCYESMFNKCKSLTTAPELPATTLAGSCYLSMFNGCTSLTTAPELPATTLAQYCYKEMFLSCKNLITAPQLNATSLAQFCYTSMFRGCSKLNNIICLATDIPASNCTKLWVRDVASSGTFTKAASMSNWTTGNDGIPNNWTVQDAS